MMIILKVFQLNLDLPHNNIIATTTTTAGASIEEEKEVDGGSKGKLLSHFRVSSAPGRALDSNRNNSFIILLILQTEQ